MRAGAPEAVPCTGRPTGQSVSSTIRQSAIHGTGGGAFPAAEDSLPTFAAVAGDTDVKERLRNGTRINGRRYKNDIDGYNLLPYLEGTTDESPRHEFWYVNDDGQIVAARYNAWKVVYPSRTE